MDLITKIEDDSTTEEHKQEASRLFTEMLKVGVRPTALGEVVLRLRNKAKDADDMMNAIRRLHQTVMGKVNGPG